MVFDLLMKVSVGTKIFEWFRIAVATIPGTSEQ
jgi:hypothetical protein